MEARLLSAQDAQYEINEWDGVDTSGIAPIGDNVIILPDMASKKVGKLGILEVPDEIVERHSLAAETGIIISMGEDAFKWLADRTRPYGGEKPKVGERVLFERYAGRLMVGKDGKTYRCMTDKTIGAKWL